MFNACNSGFWPFVRPLVQAGIPAVVGVQGLVSNLAALNFAEKLYQSLAVGLSLDEAMSYARLWVVENSRSHYDCDWARFMVYMPTDSAVLFSPLAGRSDPAPPAWRARCAGRASSKDWRRNWTAKASAACLSDVAARSVLILGRFTDDRKAILDAIRRALQTPPHGYVPIVFDFEKPGDRSLIGSILRFASVSRFVIADLSDPKSVPAELQAIVPQFTSLPVAPIIDATQREYPVADDILSRPSVPAGGAVTATKPICWTSSTHRSWPRPKRSTPGSIRALRPPQQVRQLHRRLDFHLVEHACAMHFHRAHADVQLVGDELVGQAFDDQAHDLAFALGQLVQAFVQPVGAALARQRLGRLGSACSMRSTSALSENGFSQKSKAPRLTASTAVGTSAWPVKKITGSARYRSCAISLSNRASPLMPGMRTSSSRQLACTSLKPGCSLRFEGLGAVVALAGQAPRAQQPGQRIAHTGVIVDHIDQGVLRRLHVNAPGKARFSALPRSAA